MTNAIEARISLQTELHSPFDGAHCVHRNSIDSTYYQKLSI